MRSSSLPIFVVLTMCVASLLALHVASADNITSSSYHDLSPIIGAGGYATSSSYTLRSIIGGMTPGTSTSATFGDNAGFLFYPYVTTPVLSATGDPGKVALSWSASTGYLGWSATTYSYGESTVSGGPYTYTSAGSSLSATDANLSNGTTYYFVVRVQDAYGTPIATSTEVSATPTASAVVASSGGGGGGGGGGGAGALITTGAAVTLSGRAYPGSTVTILRDATVVSSVNADSDAKFQTTLSGLAAGSYIFSLYGEDAAGNRSSLLSFPVSLTTGATTNIAGIFIAPTISTDKQAVKQGDNIAIFGASAPSSTVTIQVNSAAELFVSAQSDNAGAYLYNLDTSPLELGDHTAKSKAAVSGEISSFGSSVGFLVGDQNVARTQLAKCPTYDLNCDGHIDLVDFSILVYWYKRPLSGKGLLADLNHDGKVDLVDFSILVSHWTG